MIEYARTENALLPCETRETVSDGGGVNRLRAVGDPSRCNVWTRHRLAEVVSRGAAGGQAIVFACNVCGAKRVWGFERG